MRTTPADIVHRILLDEGPMDDASLLAAARRAGAHLTGDALYDLLHDGGLPLVVCVSRGRHWLADAMLSGRMLTHRLTDAEVAHDVLTVEPDFGLLAPLLDTGSGLLGLPGGAVEWGTDADDTRCEELEGAGIDPDEVLALPPGTLGRFTAGATIGIRPGSDGAVLGPARPGIPPADLAERIRGVLAERSHGPGPRAGRRVRGDDLPAIPMPADDLLATLFAQDPRLCTEPLPPLAELLDQLGFQLIDGDVADGDVDPDTWRTTREVALVVQTHGISVESAVAVTAISSMVATTAAALRSTGFEDDPVGAAAAESARARSDHDRADGGDVVHDGGTPDGLSVAALSAALQDPSTAKALLAEALDGDDESAVVLGALAEDWEEIAPRRSRGALRWIQARCKEALGHPADAEQDLAVARSLDAHFPPVLEDLARYAGDRGDAELAISLLRQAGTPGDDDDVVFLQGLARQSRPDLGRNQPCWCGSGRKYKVCHLGREALSLGDRATWLYRKAARYAAEGGFRYLMLDLAQIRARYDHEDDALLRALHDPLITDAVLFEGGAADEFLAVRGFLLPDDERMLLEMWLHHDRSVFAVTDVHVGQGFAVRDLRTGDVVEVTDRAASRQVRTGHRLLMRLLPVEDTWQIFGGVEPLPMRMEESALRLCDALAQGEAEPEDLVSFATSRFAPPILNTTDGEPMVSCTAHYRVGDIEAATAELDRRYEGDGEGGWTRTDGVGEHPTVLGSLDLDGRTLTVTAMNEKRFDRLLQDLAGAPGLQLLDQERVPAAEMMRRTAVGQRGVDAGPRAARADLPDDLERSPAMQAAMEGFARDYERKWLDMSIPALGGATPRQAADDPTRRGDLIRLLDDLEEFEDRPGTMQPARLRAALGL